MHLAVVRSDLTRFMHVHGYPPGDAHLRAGHREARRGERFGPDIDADITFPDAGIYTIFCQVKHRGRELRFSFMVQAD